MLVKQWLMLPVEREALAAEIEKLPVVSYLEIGSGFGGSALIAYQTIGEREGQIVCLDLNTGQIHPELRSLLSARARFIDGKSPAALAVLAAEGLKFNFVLIDGDHERNAVIADVDGLIANNLLMPGATLLFHDANYPDVAEAIDLLLAKLPLQGPVWLTTEAAVDDNGDKWGGLVMMRYEP